jgi:hypothetical protein
MASDPPLPRACTVTERNRRAVLGSDRFYQRPMSCQQIRWRGWTSRSGLSRRREFDAGCRTAKIRVANLFQLTSPLRLIRSMASWGWASASSRRSRWRCPSKLWDGCRAMSNPTYIWIEIDLSDLWDGDTVRAIDIIERHKRLWEWCQRRPAPATVMIPDIWVDSSFARFASSDDADAFVAQHGGRPSPVRTRRRSWRLPERSP